VPEDRRQLCRAHLKRYFRKIVECGGPSALVARRGLRIVKDLFAAWHAFEAGGQLGYSLAPTTLSITGCWRGI
jgi:hypothetical protein